MQHGIGLRQVREACVDDADAYLRMHAAILAETEYMLREPDEFNRDPQRARRFIERIGAAPHSTLRVAVEGEALLGFVKVEGNGLRRRRHAATVIVGVLREHWGRGVARALLRSMLDWAPGAGLSRLELSVDAGNVRAIQLYQRLGFEIEGLSRRAVIINGVPRDDHEMALLL